MDSCRAAGTEIALELGPGRALAKMADVIASDGVKIGTVDHLDGPDLEEVLVVEKRLVLKREIRIHRRTRAEVVEIPVSLRKQRVKLERE
jgi:stress response protein YsnF